jgi:hypothetical protein
MIKVAIIIQIIHLVYHQITTLVDFFPFNGVRVSSWRLRLIDAGSAFVPMAIPPIGFILGNRPLMQAGVVCNFIILASEIGTWWIPYFFGASPKWIEIYNKIHRETITVIPRRGVNPVINLEHMILMMLTLLTTVVTLMAYRSVQGAFSRHIWVAWLIGVAIAGGTVFQCSLAGRKRPVAP